VVFGFGLWLLVLAEVIRTTPKTQGLRPKTTKTRNSKF
jgi:hypothetical protein